MAPSQAEYAKINIACKELGIDKYQIIFDRYGISSSTQLTPFQVDDLLSHFRKLGWRVKRKKSGSQKYQKDAAKRKVIALWLSLYDVGKVRNRSDKALQAYVKRMTGIENLQWCTPQQVSLIIESLKSWLKREEK